MDYLMGQLQGLLVLSRRALILPGRPFTLFVLSLNWTPQGKKNGLLVIKEREQHFQEDWTTIFTGGSYRGF
jgi:hypothetical protein